MTSTSDKAGFSTSCNRAQFLLVGRRRDPSTLRRPRGGLRLGHRGRCKAGLTNSGFGTVFGVADGKPMPVCDYAGFAPFGFGYRRCPGEQLTIDVFGDFLRKVWKDKIEFVNLHLPNPRKIPIGPNAVIDDDIGFIKPA
jgi:hypothetical protein